jgi:hypothetical protein
MSRRSAVYRGIVSLIAMIVVVQLVSARAFAQSAPSAAAHRVYLPFLQSAAAALSVPNGNFEAGSSGVWRETSTGTGAGTLIRAADRLGSGVTPRGGQWAAWLGGLNDETSTLSQRLEVPSDAAKGPLRLTYSVWVRSGDECGGDIFRLQINGVNVKRIDLCAQTATSGWVSQSVDLTAYAGRAANLTFRVTTDGSYISSLYLDDIATRRGSEGE